MKCSFFFANVFPGTNLYAALRISRNFYVDQQNKWVDELGSSEPGKIEIYYSKSLKK